MSMKRVDDELVYGPPGTGKTTYGLQYLEERVEEGVDLRRAAFVSYTNAAVNEARTRIGERFEVADPEEELPYCRTLHSLCKRVLGVSGKDWLADKRLGVFADECGYDLKPARSSRGAEESDDLEHLAEASGRDAPLLRVWDFARHRLIPDADAGWRAFVEYSPESVAYAPAPRFREFVADYERWKRANWLRDYTDLLTEFAEAPTALPVSVAVVDECQDLSPLMWRVSDAMFAEAERRLTIGDDDQAIYCFSGAAPELMNQRAAARRVKLTHSYRLPRAVCAAALEIINRNENREPKQIIPRDEAGMADYASSLHDLALLNGESWSVMVRNWALLDQIAPLLEHDGIPYRIAGGKRYSPWSDRGPLRAVRALLALASGGSVSLMELRHIVERTHTDRKDQPGAWCYGAKAKLERRAAEYPTARATWSDLADLGMTRWGFERVLKRDLSILTREISERDREAYSAAVKAGTFGRTPTVTLASIHSQKGTEADNAVVMLACTGAPARSLLDPARVEDERRVAYVGATRARHNLYALRAYPQAGIYSWNLIQP